MNEKPHSYLGAFSAMLNDQALIATHSVKAIDFARENPRLAIWLGTLDTVAWVYLQIQEIDLASEERVSGEAARDILRLIAAGELGAAACRESQRGSQAELRPRGLPRPWEKTWRK
jgi:hypothetical protein